MLINLLLVFIPISIILTNLHLPPLWVFLTSVVAIIPLAEWIRRSTEQIALRAGPSIGALLNVSFGNLAELLLALFVLIGGFQNVVKAQITGSIIGNSLLGTGLAVLLGSWKHGRQTFSRERAGQLSSLLILVMLALILPALFDYTEKGIFGAKNPGLPDEKLSLGVSIVLILVYVINFFYSMASRHDVFNVQEGGGRAVWPLWRSLVVLGAAAAFTALEAEQVSDTIQGTASALGFSPLFLGLVVLALVGNLAEYFSAVYFARQNQIGLSLGITMGSTLQVALLIAPLLVLISFAIGKPMNLVFNNPLELFAVVGIAFAVNAITKDGETTWFEGLLLLAVYALFALAFFFVTP